MRVETQDWRPSTTFDHVRFTRAALLAGLLSGALGLGFLTVFVFADLGGPGLALGISEDPEPETEVPELEPEVIEAAFVQLGREFRPRELPDRAVPTSSTAPQQPSPDAVSKRIVTPREREEQQTSPNAYEDLLAQLGNTSRHVDSNFAAETEGDPNGNEEGRFSSDGNVYLGQLLSIVKRGWRVPVTIPDSELVGLRAAVSFRISANLEFIDLRLSQRSGNADYDRSIEQRLAEIRESVVRLPEPPAADRARFIGPPITFRMLPPTSLLRDAQSRLDRADSAPDAPAPAAPAPDAPSPAPAPEPESAPAPAPQPSPEPAPAPAPADE